MLVRTEAFRKAKAGFAPRGVIFDGVDDFGSRGADLTGNSDGKLLTVSFWFWIDSTAANLDMRTTTAGDFRIQFLTATNAINLRAEDAAGNLDLSIRADPAAGVSTGAWHHVLFSANMAVAGSARAYLDDTDTLVESAFVDDTLDWTKSDHWIGAAAGGAATACRLGEYYETHEYIDLDVEANRRKFISASGAPVDLGSDGSTPTGNQPIIYLSYRGGSPSDFLTNRGSGAGFTVNGAPSDGGAVSL